MMTKKTKSNSGVIQYKGAVLTNLPEKVLRSIYAKHTNNLIPEEHITELCHMSHPIFTGENNKDIGCYSIASAFYEKTITFGQRQLILQALSAQLTKKARVWAVIIDDNNRERVVSTLVSLKLIDPYSPYAIVVTGLKSEDGVTAGKQYPIEFKATKNFYQPSSYFNKHIEAVQRTAPPFILLPFFQNFDETAEETSKSDSKTPMYFPVFLDELEKSGDISNTPLQKWGVANYVRLMAIGLKIKQSLQVANKKINPATASTTYFKLAQWLSTKN